MNSIKIFFILMLARIRSLIMWILYPIYLILFSGFCVLMNILFNNRKIDNWIIKKWAHYTCVMFGVSVEVKNAEKIPKGQGGIYLFNHTSFFDIWSMSATLPSFRFGSKIEIFNIPVFGWALKRVGVLPIDREKKESVLRVYDEAKTRIKNGDRFALAPEGTRQDQEVIGPFKSGPFILAIQCESPLFPVIILNAQKVMPKNHYIPGWNCLTQKIIIEVLDPIPTKGYSVDDRKILMDQVRDIMETNLERIKNWPR